MKLTTADLSAHRCEFKRLRRLAFNGFVDFDGVVRKNQLSVVTPVRSRIANFTRDPN